jgi:predicted ATPase
MLIRLEIENFYSIREAQVLDLSIARNVPDVPGRFAPPFEGSHDRVAKVAVLFGPNASGKTNILKSVAFLKWFVASSFQIPPDARLPLAPFSDSASWNGQTRLAVRFGGHLVESQHPCEYDYETTIQHGQAGAEFVSRELLRFAPKGRFVRLIERNRSDVRFGDTALLGGTFESKISIRDNASVISTLAQHNYPIALRIQRSLQSVLSNLRYPAPPVYPVLSDRGVIDPLAVASYYAQNPSLLDKLNDVIRRVDLGIERVEIERGGTGPVPMFTHEGLSVPMNLEHESEGTRNFFSEFPRIFYVLESGGLLTLDELDGDIHPALLPEILGWFYDPKRNPRNAQAIVTCHNASLLEHLEKEEVFFTEKRRGGNTILYGARDIEGVRRDENMYRKYLGGVYGAIPRLG